MIKKHKTKRIEIRVDMQEYAAIKDYCKHNNTSVSELTRVLYLHSLPFLQDKREPEAKTYSKFTIRLGKRFADALEQKTIEAGYTRRTQYVYSLLHAKLFGKAQLNEQEIEAAKNVVIQLQNIGRNVNQIAKAMNAGFSTEPPDIEQLRGYISRSKSEILSLIASGHERFANDEVI